MDFLSAGGKLIVAVAIGGSGLGTAYESPLDLVFPSVLASGVLHYILLYSFIIFINYMISYFVMFFLYHEAFEASPIEASQLEVPMFCILFTVAGGVDPSRFSSWTARAYSDSTGAFHCLTFSVTQAAESVKKRSKMIL